MIETTTLNMIVQEKLEVTIFLTSGFPVKGQIVSFDEKAILFDSMGCRKLIYKHAIAMIEFLKF
jgi:host factor-I protein